MLYHQITDVEQFVKDWILQEVDSNQYSIFLFGSRADGSARDYSDGDIGIYGRAPMPYLQWLRLREKTEAMPWKVDIIDFQRASEAFRKIALQKVVLWNDFLLHSVS
jgi:predicted nucleotidyltransferase